MRSLLPGLKLILVVLLIPIVPFLFFGSQIESAFGHWQVSPPEPYITAGAVIGLLATDVFLPVPSSMVCTLAGSQLGVVWGTLACWIGLTAGAALGFGLARRWGRSFATRLAKTEDLDRLQAMSSRYGASVLVATRAAPVLAEVCVLLVGIHRLSWRKFVPPVILSNLGIALAYTAFGRFAQQHQWLPLALAISLAFPMVIGAAAQRLLRTRTHSGEG